MTDGVRALFRAVSFLLRTRRAWPLAAAPVLVTFVLCVLIIAVVLRGFVPWLIALLPSEGVVWHMAGTVLRWIAVLLSALFGLWFGSWLAPLLSAPALERLVRLRESSLRAVARPAASAWRQFACAVQAQVAAVVAIGPVIALLWIVTWIVPPAALVTVPLEFLALSGLCAWSMLDYPLSLRGMPAAARLALLRRHAPAVLAYGATLAALFAVPLLSLFVLPIAVVAAAELSVAMDADRGQHAAR
jgi:CysZ protein